MLSARKSYHSIRLPAKPPAMDLESAGRFKGPSIRGAFISSLHYFFVVRPAYSACLFIMRGVLFVEPVIKGFSDQTLALAERHHEVRIFVELAVSH
jgi:hypothetical protein